MGFLRVRTFCLALTLSAALSAAQNTTGSSALKAEAAFPKCALGCMATFMPQSSCGPTDIACICADQILNANISGCAKESCTIKELLTTQNVTMTMCKRPVRDWSSIAPLVGVIGGGFALLAFVLRVVSRMINRRVSVAADDYAIAAVVLLAVPPTAFSVVLAQRGLGKDIWTLPFENITNILYYYFLGEIFYLVALALNKIAILLFCLRVFKDTDFRLFVFVGIGLCSGYGVAFLFATCFQCNPVSYTWHQWDGEHVGSCNNIHLQGWLSAIFNIILDLYVLLWPLPRLSKLRVDWKKKLMVILMFSMGLLVTIISIIRLYSLFKFAHSENLTWDYVPAAFWSTLELHVGIMCSCVPSIRSLLEALFSKHTSGTTSDFTKGSLNTLRGPCQKPGEVVGSKSDSIPLVDTKGGQFRSVTTINAV